MDKYRKDIYQELCLVSDKGKVLFGALTTERLYPNYAFFQKLTGWGNLDILTDGLSLVYQSLIKDDLFSTRDIEEIIAKVNVATPHTEDFPGIATSFALDACTAIYSLLNYLLDNNIEYVVDVAIYARDTVDMFIQEKYDIDSSDPEIEFKIANDPLMINEKVRQKELLRKLTGLDLSNLTDEIIESLRDRSSIIELEILGK